MMRAHSCKNVSSERDHEKSARARTSCGTPSAPPTIKVRLERPCVCIASSFCASPSLDSCFPVRSRSHTSSAALTCLRIASSLRTSISSIRWYDRSRARKSSAAAIIYGSRKRPTAITRRCTSRSFRERVCRSAAPFDRTRQLEIREDCEDRSRFGAGRRKELVRPALALNERVEDATLEFARRFESARRGGGRRASERQYCEDVVRVAHEQCAVADEREAACDLRPIDVTGKRHHGFSRVEGPR